MKQIGTFQSRRWGLVQVLRATYLGPAGPLAIVLQCDDGEPLATLSVNMYQPECTQDSTDLPPDCFYVKRWEENAEISQEALASGLFKERPDLPVAESGWVQAPVWQLAGAAEVRTFTPGQLDELAAAIANPELSLADVPRWPQWFRALSGNDQDAAMRALMAVEQPQLEAAVERLWYEKYHRT